MVEQMVEELTHLLWSGVLDAYPAASQLRKSCPRLSEIEINVARTRPEYLAYRARQQAYTLFLGAIWQEISKNREYSAQLYRLTQSINRHRRIWVSLGIKMRDDPGPLELSASDRKFLRTLRISSE